MNKKITGRSRSMETFNSTVPQVEEIRSDSLHNATIGEMVAYTAICLIVIALIYLVFVLSKRSVTTRHLKRLASNMGNTTPLRHYIKNPGAIHIVGTDYGSELEWDKDDLQLDPEKQRRYLESISSPT